MDGWMDGGYTFVRAVPLAFAFGSATEGGKRFRYLVCTYVIFAFLFEIVGNTKGYGVPLVLLPETCCIGTWVWALEWMVLRKSLYSHFPGDEDGLGSVINGQIHDSRKAHFWMEYYYRDVCVAISMTVESHESRSEGTKKRWPCTSERKVNVVP